MRTRLIRCGIVAGIVAGVLLAGGNLCRQASAAEPSASRQIVCDFRAEPPRASLYRAQERGQSMALRGTGDGRGLNLSWNASVFPYAELMLETPVLLEEFELANFYVQAVSGGSCSARAINVRLVDANSEVFQWRAPVDWRKAGAYELKIPVTKDSFAMSYGAQKTGVIHGPLRVLGLSIDFEKESAGGDVLLQQLGVELSRNTTLHNIKMRVLTGARDGILLAGEAQAPVLEFRNPTAVPVACQLLLQQRDLFGGQTEERSALTIPGKGTALYTILHPQAGLGIHYLTARLSPADGGSFAELTDRYALLQPLAAVPAPQQTAFLMGICSHPNWVTDPAVYRKEAQAIALCGARVLRVDLEWHHIQKERGQWDFSRYDQIVQIFGEYGIELDAILNKPPKWARTQGNLPDLQLWREFVARTVERYRGKIRLWEVWNEPDLKTFATFNAAEYVELVRVAREEIRRLDPAGKVMSGGFASVRELGNSKPGFYREVLRDGGGLFDIHAHHEHGAFRSYVQMIDTRLLPLREELKIRAPWYANETAISSANIGELVQATTLYKKLLFSWARGAIGYNWYNLRNKETNPKDGEENYGMLLADYHPKAVYPAYQALAAEFGRSHYVGQLALPENQWGLEFAEDEASRIALWNEAPDTQADLPLVMHVGEQRAQRVDLMGNAQALPVRDGMVVISTEKVPATLVVTGRERPRCLGPLVQAECPALAVPGRRVPLKVKLMNPFSAPLAFQLGFSLPEGVTMEQGEAGVIVAPGQVREVERTILIGGGFRPRYGQADTIGLQVATSPQEYALRLPVPLNSAYVAGGMDMTRRPDFLLHRREQVVALFDADPANVHRVWRGPEDLSVAIWLGHREDSFTLHLEVTDDQQVQPYAGTEVWQGDGVQLALAIPGQNGLWEIGASRLDSGRSEAFVWRAPAGYAEAVAAEQIRVETTREGDRTRYDLSIPYRAIGLTPQTAREGFRMNLIVNDNDGAGRKGWIQIVGGIGESKRPELYPFVILD